MRFDFPLLMQRLQKRLGEPLPGAEAQYLMAPSLRKSRVLNKLASAIGQPSAVLILLYPEANGIHTVLMKRQVYKGAHSGQISYPGGKTEKGDLHAEHTALRETREELGIERKKIHIVGKLTELFVPASGFMIQPIVGWASHTPQFKPDKREVAQLITISLDELFDQQIKKVKNMRIFTGIHVKTPYYDLNGETLWGATAMITRELEAVFESL